MNGNATDAHPSSPRVLRLLLGACSVAAVLTGLVSQAPPAKADEPGSQFVSVTPVRFVDTNNGTGGSSSPLGAAATRSYTVPGLPSNATAVLLDVAATSATVDSSLRIWPYGEPMPSGTSVLAIESTQLPDSNSVILPLGTNGKISVWNGNGSVDFNLDLHGYFVPSDGTAGFHALTSERIVDSPAGLGVTGPTITAGTAYDIQVTGDTVPEGATAIFANIKLSSATVEGGLRVAKGGASLSGLPSALNFDAGVTTDSGITIPLSSAGKLRLASTAASGTVKIYIDVQGYFAPGNGAEFHVGSQQILVNGISVPGLGSKIVTAEGNAGLPDDGTLGSVVTTVFVTGWQSSGGVSVSNPDYGSSNLSNISFTSSMDSVIGVNSTAIVPASSDGKLIIRNKSTDPVLVRLTVQGWFDFWDDPEIVSPEDEPEDDPEEEPEELDESDLAEGDENEWAADSPTSAARVVPQSESSPYAGANSNPFRNYNAPTWRPCSLSADRNHLVRSFYRTKFDLSGHAQSTYSAELRCGVAEQYGYRHLLYGHKNEAFQAYSGIRNWRDYADWSMSWALDDPDVVTYEPVEKKWCYSRRFRFYIRGELVKVRWTNVIMGTTAKRIITAYPNKKNKCRGTVVRWRV